jgi:hypothetical protein
VSKNSTRKQNSRLALRYIDDQIVMSDTHVWTYMRIPTVPYEFRDDAARKSIAERIYLALAALVTGTEPIDAHLLITSRPFNAHAWAEALDARKKPGQQRRPGWRIYLNAMVQHLDKEQFLTKEVYLGICLGSRRGSMKEQGLDLLAPLKKFTGFTEKALGVEDFAVSKKEIEDFRAKAREVQRSLGQSQIHAQPVHADTVAWLAMKPLYPDMDTPPPTAVERSTWGPGEVQALAEGFIDNGRRHLEVTQVDWETGQEVTGYTATLAFSRFPDVLHFPSQEPWMHFASALAFPVELSSRFTLVPAAKVQKDVGRKLMEVKDQAHHIAETGAAVPLEIQEQYGRATALEYIINKDRQPWVYGRHRLRVSASDFDELTARVKKTVEHYRDLSIDVAWPSGDQYDLLLESMPADRVHGKAYFQRQELHMIGGGMPTASAEVGDQIDIKGKGWLGPYIGETTSRVRTAVHFSPHVAMAKNRPPGVAIIGSPGGGKSFCAFTCAYQDAMQGVWTIYIDPKADAKPMTELAGLGGARSFDLAQGNDGMLDPFTLADDVNQAALLALETVRLLLGGSLSGEREEALIVALNMVAAEPQPSLGRVVDVLLANQQSADARALGLTLDMMRKLPFAKLCFSARGGDSIRPEDGLTVITLLGLELPTADINQSDYSYENRLAVSVMYLLTRYARQLMLSADKDHPKSIYVDEAWAITSTPQGAKLIPEVARMGRSHNTALVLVTQNAGDLRQQAVTNSISTVFAFRASKNDEIDEVLDLLNADIHEGHRSAVRELLNGECLMRDVDGRIARVQIDAWNRELFTAFDTNPETRGKKTQKDG